MADFLAPVRAIFGAGRDASASVLPGGRVPSAWAALADAQKPAGYDSEIATVLAYFYGWSAADTRATLTKAFPKNAANMTPVLLPVLRKMVRETARAFAGEPRFVLVGAAGEEVEETSGLGGKPVKWQDVIDGAELYRKAVELDRLTVACRRAFVRVGWDDEAAAVRLALFTPDRVHVRFRDDHHSLQRVEGILLDVEPAIDAQGRPLPRWEWWTLGADAESPEPYQAVVDERGSVVAGGPFDYVDDDGTPVLPFVTFAAEDDDAGYWLRPSQEIVTAARSANMRATVEQHIALTQSFGQWYGVPVSGGDSPEAWDGQITFGPDFVPLAPRGWDLRHTAQAPQLDALRQSGESYLKTLAHLESLPPGSVTAEARSVPSGVALQVERQPLTELRDDAVGRYWRPMQRLLKLIRLVWNAHNPTSRFIGVTEHWEAGDMRGPADPTAERQQDKADVELGLTSPARLIAARDGIPLDDAKAKAVEIAAENASASRSVGGNLARFVADAAAAPTDKAATNKAAAPEAKPADKVAPVVTPKGTPAPGAPGTPVANTALNGAQVASMVAVIQQVALGQLPRESGIGILQVGFRVSAEEAEEIMGDVGRGFTPEPPAAPTAPAR